MQAGQLIGGYLLTGFLGKGGMGEVWLATHRDTGHEVAIKGLHSYLINEQAVLDRFRREAETLALLQHPNIAGLVDYVEDHNGLYLVLEYVPGDPLDEVIDLKTGPIPEQMAIAMFRQILKGVDYAHQRGIIHRDIKPSNFLITEDGTVKILDFGIAKYLSDDKKMTRIGTRMGTVLYMSPEQVEGKPVDHRSDIYSLGVTLFQMLTAQPPYPSDSSEFEVFEKITKIPLPRARTLYPAVSDRMQAIVDRATGKHPENRFQTCSQFLAALTSEGPFKSPIASSSGNPPQQKWKMKVPGYLSWLIPVTIVAVIVAIGFTQKWGMQDDVSPSEVANRFFDAVEEKDSSEAEKWATRDCNNAVKYYLDAERKRLTYRVVREEIEDERAVVYYTKGGGKDLSELKLIKMKGKWKVSCQKENLLQDY